MPDMDTIGRNFNPEHDVPAYRHLHLQRALVAAAIRWLQQQQPNGPYQLNTWGDSEEAVTVYRELGFELHDDRHMIEYLYQN